MVSEYCDSNPSVALMQEAAHQKCGRHWVIFENQDQEGFTAKIGMIILNISAAITIIKYINLLIFMGLINPMIR
jgi:hypothetical protein